MKTVTTHTPHPITKTMARELASFSLDAMKKDLKHLVVERVPNTPSHTLVKEYIIKSFRKDPAWTVELDTFYSETPLGKKKFTNIIVSYSTGAPKTLLLATHYDSKYFPDFKFVGATDAATSCAILMELSRSLLPYLKTGPKGLIDFQMVFFDGEESFDKWSETDSLYGSRHLAEKWSKQLVPNTNQTRLQQIELFVLLDLIGEETPEFFNTFKNVSSDFGRLRAIQFTLKNLRLFKMSNHAYFSNVPQEKFEVSDDYTPFIRRGVRCMPLIVMPFPKVWHKATDTISALHGRSIMDITNILRLFVFEYLHLHKASQDVF